VSIGGPRAAGGRIDVAWRGLPDVAALPLDGIDDLRTGIATLSAGFRGTLAPSDNPRVESAVPALLERVGRSVLVSRSGVILLTIQFAVLAGYAIVLVAGLLVERRRAEIALVRSRGASGLHLVAMALIESTYLAVPAAILAPWLALGVVTILGSVGPTAGLGIATSATVGSGAVIVSALAGVACVLALTLPTLFVSASPAGARAAEGRQARTTLAQRLGLDLALVAVAAVALWQLRLYGAPLTRNARGAFGLDPLLVAAPAIGLVGGAVLALRVVPRIAELGERLVVRGRGLVGSLGGRQLARRPLRYTRTALLLMLAAALGTLAAAHAATWSRSQADQAAYQAAADVRVVADDYSDLATWAAGPLYRSIPGVVAATPVAYAPIDVGRVVRAGRLIGLDPTATVVAATGATGPDGRERTALLDQLAANRPTTASVALAGSPVRMAVTIDADFRVDPDLRVDSDVGGAIPVDNRELHVSVLLADRDGRLLRAGSADGSITATGQRLVVALIEDTAQPLRPSGPLRLVGIEMTIVAPDNVAILGSVSIVSVETSEASTGDTAWTRVRLDPAGAGWRWDQLDQASRIEFPADPAAPYRVDVGREREIFGFPGSSGSSFRVFAGLSDEAILPAIASRRFLDQTSASVGETVAVDSLGRTLHVRLIAVADRFAPFDPDASFLITDLAALDALRLAATGATVQADEWWLAVDPVKSDGVLAELRQPASEARLVIGRDELTRTLSSDPVPLGLIGVLGLGSLAAMVFAGIGFLVSVTVSTSERLGEFALLRAIGLSVGQLALWLSIESIFLLVVGLIAGSLLGLLLAWLVLPFATLTQTGTAPVPAPIVLVPWEAIAPVYGVAVVLFVVSIWLVRRQLPDIRISGVLRARGG
ncbi:MAG TPA: FtsX-like permease family protein, partial [Candidatus Limnocylindrales bacterium]|nr:FtsX-like permease family protein [Candidatus Limnocylindrales bacterium]